MRYSFHIALVLLVMLVTGCGGAYRYDSRLAAADSLMHDLPDSALALIQAVNPASLTREGDRAYRDLLLTQARYRCYITATSDSDINRALNYYRRHDGEREKLTRAYIYKGAVMEELGHPDSAMLYYKHAEATAAPTDYFNLGYAKIRIADLYQDQVSQDSAAIIRLKEAIYYFTLLNDTNYLITSYGDLGIILIESHTDSTAFYLNKAIELAQQFNPSKQYTYKSKLSGYYLYYKDDYRHANALAMDVLTNGENDCDETQFYYYAALSYLKLGHLDSSKIILKLAPQPIDAVDSMNYFNVLAEIASAERNHDIYKECKERSHDITERILSESKKGEISVAESEYDKLQTKSDFETKKYTILKIAIFIFLLLLIAFFLILYYAHNKLVSQAKDFKDIKSELEIALADLKNQFDRNKSVTELVSHRISALNELYQVIRIRIKDSDRVKKVIPLSSVLKSMNERNEILNINLNDKFWDEMKLSVDGEYNGIYSYVEKHFPNLAENDLKLFCLLCTNLSPQIIKLCLNLTSARTVTNYRSLLIKKKMGLNMSFDSFLQKYINGGFFSNSNNV